MSTFFCTKTLLHSSSLIEVWFVILGQKKIGENVGEIDTWAQFQLQLLDPKSVKGH